MKLSTLASLLALISFAVASPTHSRRPRDHPKRRVCKTKQQPVAHQRLAAPSVVQPGADLIGVSASGLGVSWNIGQPTHAPHLPIPSASHSLPSPPARPSPAPPAPDIPSPPVPPFAPLSPAIPPTGAAPRADKHVFAHFMVGIVYDYDAPAWEADMTLAKSAGISGFALNIGLDPYNEKQLDLAYAAGDKLGFDLFISFDFNWFTLNDYDKVINLLKRYAGEKSQLLVEGKVFVSTFIGDGFDWGKVAQGVGKELYAVPFYQPKTEYANRQDIDGLFSWAAWPGQLDNQPIKQNMTLNRDTEYMTELSKQGKMYMAPVSPWFSTHFGKEVPYSKNWVFYSELLWKTRWDQILAMGDKLNFIEIVTWNDYGESHNIGPYGTKHSDDGSGKWSEGLDHTAMLDMAVPYITAFRAGLTEPVITQDMVVYWYRPHLKSASCDSTDNCGSKPTGWEMLDDSVFVTVLSRSGGTVTVTSGNNAPSVHQVPAGSHAFSVPMGVGKQNFKFVSNGGGSKEGTSTVPISDQCWNGIYNYNFHSGSIKL